MGKKKNEDSYEYYQMISSDGLKDTPKKKESIYNKIPEKEKAHINTEPINAIRKYRFKGSIKRFGKVVMNKWEATTSAVSKKKALSNLTYRAKKNVLNLERFAGGVELEGSIEEIEE